MQKTLTINGKRYTGKNIAKLFSQDNMTNGEDYIVDIDGLRFFGNWRHDDGDGYLAPVCSQSDANCIALMPANGIFGYSYRYDIWMPL